MRTTKAKDRNPPDLAVREGDHGGRLWGMKSLPAARAERPLSDQLADLCRSAGADGDTRGKAAYRASARRC